MHAHRDEFCCRWPDHARRKRRNPASKTKARQGGLSLPPAIPLCSKFDRGVACCIHTGS